MNLDIRFGTLLHQKADASRMIAGKILIDDPPTGENQWILFVRDLIWLMVFNGVKLCFAVRMIKPFFKQTRRSGMVFRWTRPKDAVVRLNFFPGDPVIIGIAPA